MGKSWTWIMSLTIIFEKIRPDAKMCNSKNIVARRWWIFQALFDNNKLPAVMPSGKVVTPRLFTFLHNAYYIDFTRFYSHTSPEYGIWWLSMLSSLSSYIFFVKSFLKIVNIEKINTRCNAQIYARFIYMSTPPVVSMALECNMHIRPQEN